MNKLHKRTILILILICSASLVGVGLASANSAKRWGPPSKKDRSARLGKLMCEHGDVAQFRHGRWRCRAPERKPECPCYTREQLNRTALVVEAEDVFRCHDIAAEGQAVLVELVVSNDRSDNVPRVLVFLLANAAEDEFYQNSCTFNPFLKQEASLSEPIKTDIPTQEEMIVCHDLFRSFVEDVVAVECADEL